MDDAGGVAIGHELGGEEIKWSTDTSNPETTWPDAQEFVARNFARVPQEQTHLMVCGSAAWCGL